MIMKARQRFVAAVVLIITYVVISLEFDMFPGLFKGRDAATRKAGEISHLMRRGNGWVPDGTGINDEGKDARLEGDVIGGDVDRLEIIDGDELDNAPLVDTNNIKAMVPAVHDAVQRGKDNAGRKAGTLPDNPRYLENTYGRRAKHGRCFLDKQMPCEAVYTRIYECLAGKFLGREPLPNFYLLDEISNTTRYTYRHSSIGFVHLPKAGGTSVEAVLSDFIERQWRHMHILHCTQFFKAATTLHDSKEFSLFTSKRTFGLHNFMNPDVPFLYLTWFRHPVSRIVSGYYYIKKMEPKRHKLYVKYVLQSKNLTECLDKSKAHLFQEFDNFAVRLMQFGDYPVIDTTFEDCCGAYTDGLTVIPEVTEEHYLVAKRNLETKMAFVGLLEDFKTSQDMLCFMLKIPCPEEEVHVNSNSHEHELTEYERSELERRNHWDIKLYKDAKRIYERQKKKYFEMTNRSEIP